MKVIFACVHHADRSKMAAAFFNRLADRTQAEGIAAGTKPGLRVHPEALAVMQKIGIDLSNAKPQRLTEELAKESQLLLPQEGVPRSKRSFGAFSRGMTMTAPGYSSVSGATEAWRKSRIFSVLPVYGAMHPARLP